jgi:uncharacterized protein DUF3592
MHILFGIVGASISLYALYMITFGLFSLFWPATDGRIQQWRVHEDTDPEVETSYDIRVVYTYTIGTTVHHGRRFCFAKIYKNDVPGNTFNRYFVGQLVRVYYNPLYPTQSVVQPGPDWRQLLALGFGLLFLYLTFQN